MSKYQFTTDVGWDQGIDGGTAFGLNYKYSWYLHDTYRIVVYKNLDHVVTLRFEGRPTLTWGRFELDKPLVTSVFRLLMSVSREIEARLRDQKVEEEQVARNSTAKDKYVYVLKPLKKDSWNEAMDYSKGYRWWFSAKDGIYRAGIHILEKGVEVAQATLVVDDIGILQPPIGWRLETHTRLSPERLTEVIEQFKAIANELDKRIREFGKAQLGLNSNE